MTNTYTQKPGASRTCSPPQTAGNLKEAFKELETRAAALESKRPLLTNKISQKEFMDVISELETLYRIGHRVSSYAELLFSSDTQNQEALGLIAKTDQMLSEIRNRTLFFNLWWKDLADDLATPLMKNAGDYCYWLEEMRHFKPHTLSEAEEKIINTKNVTGVNALNTLYDSYTNRYMFKMEVDGEVKDLTRGELMSFVRSDNPDMRARAYQELYRVYGDDASILGQMYQTIVRDWRNEQVTLRHHKSPISARNLVNDLPDEVIDLLLETCRKNTPCSNASLSSKPACWEWKNCAATTFMPPWRKPTKTIPTPKLPPGCCNPLVSLMNASPAWRNVSSLRTTSTPRCVRVNAAGRSAPPPPRT